MYLFDKFVLHNPLDMHVHFRRAQMLKDVVPYTARHFCGATVMPNPEPIIDTEERVIEYKGEVLCATGDENFTPYMTLYFQPTFTREFLERVKPLILTVKFYSKGMTTNSEHGTDPHDPRVPTVLGYMQDLDIPLSVHGEAKGFCMHREALFGKFYADWAVMFPKLRIIMEHITTAGSAYLLRNYPNLYATITTHHLFLTLDDVLGDGICPHCYAKPIPKEPGDLAVLRELVFGFEDIWEWRLAFNKVMLGTDSAPHPREKKECECGCAGIFNSPYTLQLLAAEFAKIPNGDKRFQAFVSDNACRIYRLKPPEKLVTVERGYDQIPLSYHGVVPMWPAKVLDWRVTKIS